MRTICQEFERQGEKGGEGESGGAKGGGEGSTNFDRTLHLMQQVLYMWTCNDVSISSSFIPCLSYIYHSCSNMGSPHLR